MTFEEYQALAQRTARAKDKPLEFYHLVLGLAGEPGEIAEKIKKLVRDHDGDMAKLDVADLQKELGDVLWYIATLATYCDIPLENIATSNIEKLKSRMDRNVLGGSGDNR